MRLRCVQGEQCARAHTRSMTADWRDSRTQGLAVPLRRSEGRPVYLLPWGTTSPSPPFLDLSLSLHRPSASARGESGTEGSSALDQLAVCGNHMEVLIYSFLKSKSFTYLSISPQRTFLSFSGRKNELLYELFQHVSGLLSVTICCNVTTLSVNWA